MSVKSLRTKRKPMNKLLQISILVAMALLVIGIIAFIASSFIPKIGKLDLVKLHCPVEAQYKAFGDNILYYNDQSIVCMTSKGKTRWSYDIGSGASFDCSDSYVVIWQGSNMYVLDSDGKSTFSDNLGSNIAFAHVYKKFVGIVLGNDRSSRMTVRDVNGTLLDEETDAYANSLILDFGFFGKDGEYMWTLKLDTDATAPNNVLNTFEVGKMNTGEKSLGAYICYKVLFENGNLHVINTREMYSFDYRISRETSKAALVYGWKYLDSHIPKTGDGAILFAPIDQLGNPKSIKELRLILKNIDKRYTLPNVCVGAAVHNYDVYAIAKNTVYKASIKSSNFNSYPLEIENGAFSIIAKLDNGKLILSNGSNVFALTLP